MERAVAAGVWRWGGGSSWSPRGWRAEKALGGTLWCGHSHYPFVQTHRTCGAKSGPHVSYGLRVTTMMNRNRFIDRNKGAALVVAGAVCRGGRGRMRNL